MIFACPFCQTKVGKTENVCHKCNATMTRHCPYCAESISVLANLCKYCGEAVEPTSSPTPVPRPAPTPAPAVEPVALQMREAPEVEFVDEVRYCAWEDRSKKGSFGRWWSTWASSQFSMSNFWSHLPAEGGHARPHRYAWYMVAQLLTLALPFVAIGGVVLGIDQNAPAYAYPLGAAAYLALYPLTFVAVALSNYVRAGLWHLPLKLLGAKGDYETTLRAVAYNSGACAWGILPGVGGIMKAVMGTLGYYHAFRGLHGMSKGRAVFAALIPLMLAAGAIVTLIALAATGAIHPPAMEC